VAVEPAGIEQEANRRLDDKLSDVQCHSRGPDGGEPTLYLRRGGAIDRQCPKRSDPLFQHDAFAQGEGTAASQLE
jgi:hypothetical protein